MVQKSDDIKQNNQGKEQIQDMGIVSAPILPLTNYTLSTVCPACGDDTYKLACKVRCRRCGFMWDCSEL